jgi:hypothetical protein
MRRKNNNVPSQISLLFFIYFFLFDFVFGKLFCGVGGKIF